MLLAFDVGNTNITLGVFDNEELLGNVVLTDPFDPAASYN